MPSSSSLYNIFAQIGYYINCVLTFYTPTDAIYSCLFLHFKTV